MVYVKKCPLCDKPIVNDDIDYNFDGNQDEYSTCVYCNHAFLFYIRYNHLWKYEKTKLKRLNNGEYVEDGENETVIVWKGS